MRNNLLPVTGLLSTVRTGVGLALLILSAESAPAAESQTLHGHVPEAIGRLHLQPTGRLPAAQQLRLTMGLPLRNQEALTNLLQQIYDPASPKYRQYLTPEQFTERFGPTEQDYQAVVNFAKTNGLEIVATHGSRILLDVRGKASDIEAAFHVTLLTYQHPTESRAFYAPDVDPSVDSSLPIKEIIGINDYAVLRPMAHRKQTTRTSGTASGSAPDGVSYMGKDFRNAYAPGVSLDGTGQMVGLFEADGYYTNDITTYEAKAGLPNVPLQNVLTNGFSGTPGPNNDEVALDIEMAISMAPGLAAVVVFEGPDNISDLLDILDNMAESNYIQIKQFSSSWGYGYDTGGFNSNTTFDQVFMKMATQGQSFFQASGDGDAWTSPILIPSASPYVTSVGGTTLTMNGSGTSYASETVWNSGYYTNAGISGPWAPNGNGYWGSGGGVSTNYAIPSWQQGVSMASNGGSTTYRNIPDVAMTADNVWVEYNNGKSGSFVGTSCAAPLWAGFTALVNQQAASQGLSSMGFLNPALYAISQGPLYSYAFHDVTSGNDTWSGSPTEFYAVTGYDLCTGLGTPNGMNLINALLPYGDVWVDFNYTGSTQNGTYNYPFKTLAQGTNAVAPGGSIWIRTSGSSSETLTISKPLSIRAYGGPATIGN